MKLYKFFIFAPKNEEVIRKIIDAASDHGAGIVGQYSHCAFLTEGDGTWIPNAGSHPTTGELGKFSKEPEVKIEMECPLEKMTVIADAIRAVHPYDHISIDAVEITRF